MMPRFILSISLLASVAMVALADPVKPPLLNAMLIVGQKRAEAEKVLGQPYKVTDFEEDVPGINSYKVPKFGSVLVDPGSVAPFKDGFVEFRVAKSLVKDALSAMKLIGLYASRKSLMFKKNVSS